MRLWIAVHLPLLPLEIFRPRWCEPGAHAVIDNAHVLVMTAAAAEHGVHADMRQGGVAAIAPDTQLHQRDAAQEQVALHDIALALLQYTPEVAIEDGISLLLDVSASLSAFGGKLTLARRIAVSVQAMGFSAQIGSAPTAHGAWLLASYPPARALSKQRRAIRLQTMIRRLDLLPCTLLPQTAPYRDWLAGIGCRTLGELRALPRAGLQRRCDKTVLAALDRAYGDAPALFEWVQAPRNFTARLELPDRIEHAEAVLFAARRLILQMIGWLTASLLAVSRFILLLEHERGRAAIAPTPIDIMLAEPAWREEHLIRLLKERLGRIQLDAPVIALRLDAPHVSAMAPPTASLFPEPGGTPADYRRLLELLSARLGADNVLVPASQADHRPELANRWTAATIGTTAMAKNTAAAANSNRARRPFWLLERPLPLTLRDHRPFYGSPLKLISGPERIESGWWDNALAVRDYFIAQGSESACYWIYRQRTDDDAQWFLHGLFG